MIPRWALHRGRWHFREITKWSACMGMGDLGSCDIGTGAARVVAEDTLHVAKWRLTSSSILSSLGVKDIITLAQEETLVSGKILL